MWWYLEIAAIVAAVAFGGTMSTYMYPPPEHPRLPRKEIVGWLMGATVFNAIMLGLFWPLVIIYTFARIFVWVVIPVNDQHKGELT